MTSLFAMTFGSPLRELDPQNLTKPLATVTPSLAESDTTINDGFGAQKRKTEFRLSFPPSAISHFC